MNNFKLTRNKFLGNIIEFESDGSVQECMYDVSDKIADIIENLQQKAELGETYKKLYGEVKKQKDDVVEDIKKQITFCTNEAEGAVNNDKCWMAVNYLKKLLRMLGEIDVED